MQNGALAYQQVAQRTATPRDLEAQLLLRAAARLSACNDSEELDRSALREALEFNRKLWTIFLSSVNRPENPLPEDAKKGVRTLALFVMENCIRLEVAPAREKLDHLISINRDIAGGLFGKAA